MKILEYAGLDTSNVMAGYDKVTSALLRDDFRAAQVKKLTGSTQLDLYRAKLNDADRLLFTIIRHGNETCALMLEVIIGHAYEKSRFLRGTTIDESKIPDAAPEKALAEARPIRYLHPERSIVHLLDKPVSFDDTQDSVYRQPPPLIIVGSAGSGKTALTLEKLKHVEGELLYVTLSGFLAENARNLYYSNGFRHTGQETNFLSYREFVESIHIPAGREATWKHFSSWFARIRNNFREIDPHQAFEEIRGVITANAGGLLSQEEYERLGVRQSIFSIDQRTKVYALFEKYRQWLGTDGLYDLNLVAHAWMEKADPRYDFIVVDEVQDLTAVQLALILRTLRKPGHFLLCGDSNQIVHPNFFSWNQVKNLFWNDPKLAASHKISVLTSNFRNGTKTTQLANRLLKIKQQRFGSIDRESNYLVDPVGEEAGMVVLMADKDTAKHELNSRTRQSARFAVLVMRDEDKAEARKHFSTPLLFSIHEAKGLEYDNIVLYGFISGNRKEFNEIIDGVDKDVLKKEGLDYNRARDKSDKSLEAYKFFINALYVALTRAVRNLYIIESDTGHRIFDLLDLSVTGKVKVDEERSSIEEWQKEVRKLELQGKHEQAEAIRETILHQTPPPWQVFDEPKLRELLHKVFREELPNTRFRQQLYEYATCHEEPVLARRLVSETGFQAAKKFENQLDGLGRKSFIQYFSQQTKGILKLCQQHGVDHRLPMNMTPIMAAASAGNIPLVEALIEAGAAPDKRDHYGFNALHWAMRRAFREPKFAQGNFGPLYELLAPTSIDLMTGERLVRLDRHIAEYFLFQTFWVLFKSRFSYNHRYAHAAFDTRTILDAWEQMPPNVLPPERNRRQYLSGLLARNEISRDYAYNRALFMRVAQGWYQLNPKLAVRARTTGEEQEWIPLLQMLNLPLIYEFSNEYVEEQITAYFRLGGLPRPDTQICSEKYLIRTRAPWDRTNTVTSVKADNTLTKKQILEKMHLKKLIKKIERQQKQQLKPQKKAPQPPREKPVNPDQMNFDF